MGGVGWMSKVDEREEIYYYEKAVGVGMLPRALRSGG